MPKIETAPAAQAGVEANGVPPAAAEPAPKAAKAKKPKAPAPEREVVYPEVDVMLCKGDDALTAEMFKDLLGWEEETDAVKFGDKYDLVDHFGKRVRLTKNGNNRPWSEPWSKHLAQDFLNRRWRLNGETVVIGRYAQTLSGQHRGVGLILAAQMWADEGLPGNARWKELWPDGPPTMEGIVVFGVDESSETTRTLDNVKPRTLADVLYTSGLFANKGPDDREALSRMTEAAVKLLWDRTGAKAGAYAPLRTHSEALDFIDRHPSLVDCVKHVHEENSEGQVREWVGPGTAAGLMYLMAAADADGETYRDADKPWSERGVGKGPLKKQDGYKRAEQFWTLLAGKAPGFEPAVEALGRVKDHATGCGGTFPERTALVINCWSAYVGGFLDGKTKNVEIGVDYKADRDDDGNLVLDDFPVLTGIDLGTGAAEALKDTTRAGDPPDPTPEEIKQAAKEEYSKGMKAGPDPDTAERYARDNPGVILLWQTETTWNAYGDDAMKVHEATHKEAKVGKLRSGLPVCKFPLDDDGANLPLIRIRAAKEYGDRGVVATVILRDGNWVVVPTKAPVKAKPNPAPEPAAPSTPKADEKPKAAAPAAKKGPKLKGGV